MTPYYGSLIYYLYFYQSGQGWVFNSICSSRIFSIMGVDDRYNRYKGCHKATVGTLNGIFLLAQQQKIAPAINYYISYSGKWKANPVTYPN
jgi:hypothetical protein